MSLDVSKQFKKYANREVSVIETPTHIAGRVRTELAEDDATIISLKKAAAKAGFSKVRIYVGENRMGTMDYHLDRLNASVVKRDDGKYYISGHFTAG